MLTAIQFRPSSENKIIKIPSLTLAVNIDTLIQNSAQKYDLTLLFTLSPLPRTAVFPARPRQMAQTILDFPVPFAPTIMFKLGPGQTSAKS